MFVSSISSDTWKCLCYSSAMKLSHYTKQQGISYRTALRWRKVGLAALCSPACLSRSTSIASKCFISSSEELPVLFLSLLENSLSRGETPLFSHNHHATG